MSPSVRGDDWEFTQQGRQGFRAVSGFPEMSFRFWAEHFAPLKDCVSSRPYSRGLVIPTGHVLTSFPGSTPLLDVSLLERGHRHVP